MESFPLYLFISCSFAAWVSSAALSDGESLQAIRDGWNLNESLWQGDDPCNGWEGVQCDANNRVFALNLSNTGIHGPMPDEISNLDHLINLDLSNLRNLSFNRIQLTTFPAAILKLSNLITLRIDNNHISGPLPVELANLTNLTYFLLYRNQLTGPLPDSWSNLTNLRNLTLINNYMTKHIPSGILTLPNLLNLSIDYNLFDGGLDLDNVNILSISVTCNYLSGAAPSPSNRILLNLTGNCFIGFDADPKIRCAQSYFNCDAFSQAVQNGSCPMCPQQQILYDPETCVCMLNTGTGETISHKGHKGAKVDGSIAVVSAVIAFMLILWWKRSGTHKRSIEDEWEGPDGVQRFLYRDLSRATNGFDTTHEIGVGGFGKVFLGTIDGRAVAIKRAHASSMQSSSGFRNEVLLLSRLHHRNLVRLLGFCEEDQIQILVYEYMPNGNLHSLLFKNNGIKLDWLRRLDIALGVAQGLEYLHSFADPPVIHRDVKPSNILLDEDLVAKLSDFGISREGSEFQTQFSTRPAGTIGYIDPQYILREHLNTASDVYSFGMVLLEILSGQKSVDNKRIDDHNLAEWAKVKLKNQRLREIVDPSLSDDYPEREYLDMIRLGIDCASFDSEDRPSMKVVVSILDACRWSLAPRAFERNNNIHEAFLSEVDDSDCIQEKVLVDKHERAYVDGCNGSFTVSVVSPR